MNPPSVGDEIEPVTPEWLNDENRYLASMEYWYPRLKQVEGVRTPKTEWVELEPDIVEEGTIHEMPWADYELEELRNAVEAVGGPPAFLRTDQASNIYEMEDSSKIRSIEEEELRRSAGGVIGFNITRAEVPVCSLVVREWLEIAHFFTAWGSKKIGVELRFFIDDGSVDSWCFDWPKEQIREPSSEEWESLYDKTKQKAEERASECLPMAEKVATAFEGAWSVDFVLTGSGEWYCTDMAPAQMSQKSTELHEV